MRQNGRKSAASLAVVSTILGNRPSPPACLTLSQAALWRAVVGTKPADWFTADSHPLLVAYCRHVATADMLADVINAVDPAYLTDDAELARLDKLLLLRDRETKAIRGLATVMRLSQQSRLKAETAYTMAAKAGDADKPWTVG
jgi:hypothetical protein